MTGKGGSYQAKINENIDSNIIVFALLSLLTYRVSDVKYFIKTRSKDILCIKSDNIRFYISQLCAMFIIILQCIQEARQPYIQPIHFLIE